MCFFKPKMPSGANEKPPMPAQFQNMKTPDSGSTALVDDQIRRKRALAATAFTGALGLGNPTTTNTVLGG